MKADNGLYFVANLKVHRRIHEKVLLQLRDLNLHKTQDQIEFLPDCDVLIALRSPLLGEDLQHILIVVSKDGAFEKRRDVMVLSFWFWF